MATTNTAFHEGQTFTRTGRKYSHAVVTVYGEFENEYGPHRASGKTTVEWASTRALAEKNATAKWNRAQIAKQGGVPRGMWDLDALRNTQIVEIVEVVHS